MVEIIRESSNLEPLLKGFIDATNTKYFGNSLNILFLNGSILEVFENSGICCLISMSGADNKIEESIDLIEGKSKTDVVPFIKEISKVILPRIILAYKQSVSSVDKNQDELHITAGIVASFMTTMPELEAKIKEMTGFFINGAFLFSDLFVVEAYKGFSEIKKSHLRSGISTGAYEEMIHQLSKLAIIEPKIRISVCPYCMNNELVVSKYPQVNDTCPKCGNKWSNSVLYLFNEQFGKVKSINADLPLFISSYLKHQTAIQSLGEELTIFPNAVIKLEGKNVEVDVYIPRYNIGIECKNYLSTSIPDTPTRAKSIAGELKQQILNYKEVGIENIYIIANLSTKTLERVNVELIDSFKKKKLIMPKVTIIQGDPNSVIKLLNELSASISMDFKKNFETMFQNIPVLDTTDNMNKKEKSKTEQSKKID